MAHKNSSFAAEKGMMPFLNLGETTIAIQKQLLESHEQATRAWLARLQSELAMWSELATSLMANRSLSAAFEAYTKCISQQLQMSAEDGQRLFSGYQQIAEKMAESMGGEWPLPKQAKQTHAHHLSN